jgi:hypothetical protein
MSAALKPWFAAQNIEAKRGLGKSALYRTRAAA